MTKEEIYEKLDTEVKLRGLSPRTYKTYKNSIGLFLDWADKPYEYLEEIDFRNYLIYLVNRVTLVDGGWQAGGLQACFYFEGRVIKNGVAFKHSPLFFAQAAGTDASPAARAIWSKIKYGTYLGTKRMQMRHIWGSNPFIYPLR